MEILTIDLSQIDIGTILTIVLAGLSTFLGVFWKKAKTKISEIVELVKELYDASDAINKALDDNKLTKEEIAGLKKEFNDVKVKFKKLISKEI